MDLLKAVILGILQGVTEFLPISSSAHLVLVPWWLGWDEPSLLFDTTLHLGTLVAVLSYFWRDWLTLLRAGWAALKDRSNSISNPDSRLLLLLIVGTLPALIIGGLFYRYFERAFSNPTQVAIELLITGGILIVIERYRGLIERTLTDLSYKDAVWVGIAQAVAIFPGISRSGTTISAGMWRGLSRPAAARFSFLLSAPIIFLAAGGQVFKVIQANEVIDSSMAGALVAGFLASMVTGYLAIGSLMHVLRRWRLYGFAIYCAVFGTLSLLVALLT